MNAHVTFSCLMWYDESAQYAHKESHIWWELCTDPRFARWASIMYQVLVHACVGRYDRNFVECTIVFSLTIWLSRWILSREIVPYGYMQPAELRISKWICAAWQGTSLFARTLNSTSWFCRPTEETLIRRAKVVNCCKHMLLVTWTSSLNATRAVYGVQ